MADRISGKTLEKDMRSVPLHPHIAGGMQQAICQQRLRAPPPGASLVPGAPGRRPLIARALSATVPCRGTPRCSPCVSAPPASIARGQCGQTKYQVNTPFQNPKQDKPTEIEVTDPCHPLYGRRFPVFSLGLSARSVGFVTVIYRDPLRLRIPISATNLAPTPQVPTSKLTFSSVTELITLAKQCEGLCLSHPKPSGTDSRRTSKTASPTNS